MCAFVDIWTKPDMRPPEMLHSVGDNTLISRVREGACFFEDAEL